MSGRPPSPCAFYLLLRHLPRLIEQQKEAGVDTYHHKNLKSDLIEAGIALVAKEGLDAFSLRKVAGLCGVSHAAPYSHFGNKDVLLEEMQKHVSECFSAELEKTIAKCKDKEALLMELGKSYLRFFSKRPNYFAFLFGKTKLALDLTERADPQKNYRPYEIFKTAAEDFLARKNCPKEKWNDITISLWAFVHGITSLATMRGAKYGFKWEEKLPDFMQIINF